MSQQAMQLLLLILCSQQPARRGGGGVMAEARSVPQIMETLFIEHFYKHASQGHRIQLEQIDKTHNRFFLDYFFVVA